MIRYATIHDAKRIATININSWQTAYKGIVSDEFLNGLSIEKATCRLKQRLSESPKELLVIENEKEIEGFLGFGVARDDDCDKLTGEIYTIYFDDNYYGNGSAQQLFDTAIKQLKQQSYQSIIIWVFEENVRARRFYERNGFTIITAKKEFKDEATEIRLLRKI